MGFLHEISERILIHDGSKGYMLQRMGLKGGECGELWNLTNQEAVKNVYRAYLEAGSDVIQTNTFPGNRVHLQKFGLEDKVYDINFWGAKLAKEVAEGKAFVSASIGPTGLLFEPSGELTFKKAYDVFCEQVKAVADGGADIINFETFTDIAELRAAYFAARDMTSLPVICSLAFENNGRTLMGTAPYTAVAILKSLGADMVGANCSFGPGHMEGIIREMYDAGSGYLSVKPNAGLPVVDGNCVSYNETPEHFAELASVFANLGARLIGGCCGTTPDFIKALKQRIAGVVPSAAADRDRRIIASAVKHIHLDRIDISNVYRLNASDDPAMSEALKRGDLSWVEDTALDLAAEGYNAIYINIRKANGSSLLPDVVDKMQWYIRDPFIIETDDVEALDTTLRIYRGIAGVVAGSSDPGTIGKVAAKYGSVFLTGIF